MQPKSIALLREFEFEIIVSLQLTGPEKVDQDVDVLLQKFQNIVEMASSENKSKEILSVETLQIENDASTIIRIAEDLLTITRTLKENWLLNSLNIRDENPALPEGIDTKMNELIDKIIKYEKKVII